MAERACLARLGASCNTPVAAYAGLADLADATVRLSAMVASDDGRRMLRASGSGSMGDAAAIGRGVADSLLAQGAARITVLEPREGGCRS